jgi:ABC-type Fe3+ transport system permease subunit
LNSLRQDLFDLALKAVPLAFFTALLVAPLASLLYAPLLRAAELGLQAFEGLTTYPFVNRRPLGEFIIYVPGEPAKLIVSFKDFGVIPNTVIAAVIVTSVATVIGTAVALVMARYSFPGRDILRIAAMIPLLYTPFVNAFVAYKILGQGGILAEATGRLLGVEVSLQGLAGMIAAQIFMFWPIVYINAFASLVQIDPSVEEQAENLGARGWRLYRTVTLPLALPGIASGAALVFIFSMEDLAAPIAFDVDNVVSIWIVREILASSDVSELSVETLALAIMLVTAAAVWFTAVRRYVSLRHYATMQKGSWRGRRLRRPGPLLAAAIYFLLVPWIVVSASQQIGVLVYAFSEDWSGLLPRGFTLDNFREVLSDERVVRAFRNSFLYASLASIIIVFVAVASAYAVERLGGRVAPVLDILSTIPLAMPGLAVALGILVLFGFAVAKGTALDPFTNPGIYLVLAYAVRKSPFTTRAAFAGLKHLHKSLEEAAMSLGARRSRVLRDITLPLIAVNVLGGLLISFVYSVTEVSTSITLGGLNEDQSPVTYIVYDYLTGGYGGGAFIHLAAAIVAMLMAMQIAAIAVVNYALKQRFAFIGV